MAKGPKDQAVSERLPVARVAVDISLAHLDRPFDYLVPARLDAEAVPGCRVRVRFAGQLVDGYLLERDRDERAPGQAGPAGAGDLARTRAHPGDLRPGPGGRRPVRGHAGRRAPAGHPAAARHRRTGGPGGRDRPSPRRRPPLPDPGSWSRYPAGAAFLAGLAEGRPVRAAWSALPGPEWPAEIAVAAATTAAAGRGVLIVVPDARDLDRVDAALTETGLDHVCLAADLGPAERYRRWLAVRRGLVRVVAGTRAAMFAPVAGLGLVVLWDDGDDLHAEPRAPYPNAREVLALRAHRTGAAALIGGFARTAELTQLVAGGWARPLTGSAEALRQAAPRVRAAPDEAELARDAAAMTARLPSLALRTAREALTGGARGGLAQGPVLVQVPRRGYLAAVACARCRAQARCATCAGPLEISGSHGTPGCRWCGALAADWTCARCGSGQLRALVTGASRTAEELGRAFPGVAVRTSGGQHVLATVPAEPALVIATPGAEPVAPEGYAAALLLDGWALLGRPSLRAAEEALRRWLNAAALVRPGGPVVVLAEATLPAVQALIRWDPVTFSERELAERAELGFPPAVRMASVTGPPEAVADFVGALSSSGAACPPGPRCSVQCRSMPGRAFPRKRGNVRSSGSAGGDGLELARALHAVQATRSARKDGGAIRVQLDPAEVA